MNPAPAELLQLLTIAALQPTTSGHSPTVFSAFSHRYPCGHEKKKPPCLTKDQAVRLVLFAWRLCILMESASHEFDRFCLPPNMQKLPCSRFDKFNHVKYTKTLSVRNPRTVKTPYWTISRRPVRAGALDLDQVEPNCPACSVSNGGGRAVKSGRKKARRLLAGLCSSGSGQGTQSQLSAPPVWYSVTRVSKKLRSFLRSIISLIHGNGFSSFGNSGSRPICTARRFAIKRR